MRFTVPAIALLALFAAPLRAVDAVPPTEPAAETKPVNAADAKIAAEAKADEGRKALQLYRKDQAANPTAVVDAALAFTEAHHLYQQIGDNDAVSEMQANIYWCKKQMNLDAVKDYVERKGGATVAEMNQVAERKVDQSEAQDYLARAQKFAADHPNDLSTISIRYFEVAERFVGTPIGIEAQKLSLDAQNKYAQWIQSGGLLRETRFTKPVAVAAGSRVPVPDDKVVAQTITDLKKIYAKDYSRKTEAQKRRLAAKLSDEAEKSRGDANTHYALLIETVRLAQEAEDYERLLDTIDLLAASYTGFDAKEQKKAWLRRLTGKPTATAIGTLLDTPTDPTANTTAGKFFCYQLRRWPQGLPMLAMSGDAELKAVAEQDLAEPADDNQRVQVADGWMAIAKKGGPSADKFAAMTRAQHWYLEAKGVTGVVRERVSQRMAEIDRSLPLDLDNIDWNSLTPTQWDKLKGQQAVIPVRVDRSGPVATLKPGQQMRVVPHPSDTWSTAGGNGNLVSTTWAGVPREQVNSYVYGLPYNNFRFCELLVAVDKGAPQSCGVVTGPGNIWMMPNRNGGTNKGQIRIKLVPVDED